MNTLKVKGVEEMVGVISTIRMKLIVVGREKQQTMKGTNK